MTWNLWLVSISLLLWSAGYGLYFFSWPLFVQGLGATAVQLGLLGSIGSIAAGVSYLPGGIWADHAERRFQLVVGWAMCIPVPAMFFFAKTWWQLIPGVVVFGLSAFNAPTLSAYISVKARPGRVTSAMTIVFAGVSAGFILSPLVAPEVQARFGQGGIFAGATLLYVLSTLCILPISRDVPECPPPGGATKGLGRLLAQEVRELLNNRRLLGLCLLFAPIAAVPYLTMSFLAPYLRDVLHRGVAWVNLFGSVTSVGGAVLAPLLGLFADREGNRLSLVAGLGLLAIGAALVVGTRWLPLIFVGVFVRGIADCVRTMMSATVAAEVPGVGLGRALGAYNLTAALGYSAGPLVGGMLYAWRPQAPFVATVLAALFLGVLVLVTHRHS